MLDQAIIELNIGELSTGSWDPPAQVVPESERGGGQFTSNRWTESQDKW